MVKSILFGFFIRQKTFVIVSVVTANLFFDWFNSKQSKKTTILKHQNKKILFFTQNVNHGEGIWLKTRRGFANILFHKRERERERKG